jgi:choice-of-anchor B domain-containing protein
LAKRRHCHIHYSSKLATFDLSQIFNKNTMYRLLLLLLCGFLCFPNLNAQNLNTTFRSKMSFPGQTLANIWGYSGRDGKEYALVGASKGIVIVDISNPDLPQQIIQIPGPDNLWKEIKTYSNYAYIVSEGGQGIQIVNLDSLPSANLPSHFYRGDGVIANQLNKIHALHIDKTKGFLYAWGGNLFNGGAKIFDLKQDPWNPVYVGKFDNLGYIHDGFVDNDTMYSGHIYAGQFAMVNMANKNAPELLATQPTPGAFTHNTWPSDDRRTIFTTDEVNNSFLTAFDVSDPTDIKELDRIQSNPGSNSMVHNTYIHKNWALTSWYKDGFTIVDVTRPDNLVQVGNYDTYSGTGGGSSGCWGVYPYFKSGTVIASNINAPGGGPGELFIITPDYRRACYLEGLITDAYTGFPITGAQIQVLGTNPLITETSSSNGQFKTGQTESGYFKVRVSKAGYQIYETSVYFAAGEVTVLNVTLFPNGSFTISGIVTAETSGNPVQDATVWLHGPLYTLTTMTDVNGYYEFLGVKPGVYDIIASATGVGVGVISGKQIIGTSDINLILLQLYRRDPALPIGSKSMVSARIFAENPFSGSTTLSFNNLENNAVIKVLNTAGQTLETIQLNDLSGQLEIGQNLPIGLYFLRLEQDGLAPETLRLIKNH